MTKGVGAVVAVVVTSIYVADAAVNGLGADFGIGASIFATGLLGGLLLWRQPENRMGWVFSIAGLGGALASLSILGGETYWWMTFGAFGWWTWIGAIFCFVPLRYPTGRISSRRMVWVGRIATGVLSAMFILGFLQERICLEYIDNNGACGQWLYNPIGITGVPNPEEGLIGNLLLVVLGVCAIAAIVSLLFRYRKSSDVERHQIKWLLYFVGLQLSWVIVVDMIVTEAFGYELPDAVYDPVVGLLWLGIPLAAGLAIFKYRLYDIDRIVSRTVTYGLVVGLLALAYVGGVALLTEVAPLEGNLAVAASTLGVAALFNPLRRRFQRVVERRFNRSRYNADLTADQLNHRLRDVTDVSGVAAAGHWAVSATVQPATISIWVREN